MRVAQSELDAAMDAPQWSRPLSGRMTRVGVDIALAGLLAAIEPTVGKAEDREGIWATHPEVDHPNGGSRPMDGQMT
jgi:hypothetical protein